MSDSSLLPSTALSCQSQPAANPWARHTLGQGLGRICIVTQEINGPFRNGGIGTSYTALAETLAQAGHPVTVLYTGEEVPDRHSLAFWAAHYRSKGIELVPLPESDVPLGGAGYLARSYRVCQWLRQHRFDVIHFHEWLGLGYYSVLARHQGLGFADTTLCVGVHSPTRWIKEANQSFLDHLDDLELDAVERRTVELADVVWSPSRYLLDWLSEHGWQLPAESLVLPYLVPSTTPTPQRRSTGPHAVAELVFFGRLEVRKGLVLFCDALDRLEEEALPPNFAVTFLGKSMPVLGRDATVYLRERSRRWRFSCRILDRCDHAEALAYLQGPGRLAIMPSLVDNSPLTVLECLHAGIPFLATRVGGIPELVAAEDRERILVAPQAAALADRVTAALQEGARPGQGQRDAFASSLTWTGWHASRSTRHPATGAAGAGEQPLVSVCLVHHNRPALLRQALASLRAQDYPNLEVVLVDDGSTQPEALAYLAELEKDFDARGWKVVRQENRYLGAARNRAAREACGRFLLFMDDDNYARPQEIATLVAVAQRTGADVVTTFMDFFEGAEAPAGRPKCRWLFAGLDSPAGIARNCFGDANALVRHQVFESLGGFTEEHGITHEDWEFFVRVVLRGYRLEVVPEALFWYRLTPGSMIRSTPVYANFSRHLRPYLEEVPEPYRDLIRLAQGLALRNQDLTGEVERLQCLRYRLVDTVHGWLRRVPLIHGPAKWLLSRIWTLARRRSSLPTSAGSVSDGQNLRR